MPSEEGKKGGPSLLNNGVPALSMAFPLAVVSDQAREIRDGVTILIFLEPSV